MKFRKNKFEKKEINQEVNNKGKKINIWDLINENFAKIKSTCKILEKSIQNISTNTNLIDENLKSQAITSKRLIDDTVANLRGTKNNLKTAKINNTSLKRDNSQKIPGLPIEFPN